MSNNLHTHGNAPPHEHADATAGHVHDAQGNVIGATDRSDTPPVATAPPPPPSPARSPAAAPPTEPEAAHTHPGVGEHVHTDAPPTAAPREEVQVGPSGGGIAARVLFTVLGAAGLAGGAFLSWFRFTGEVPPGIDLAGVNTSRVVFYSTDNPFNVDIVQSAGGVMIVLAVLALLGLAFRTGWLTTLAGVLGIVGVGLVIITLYRVEGQDFGIQNVGIGLWLVLAGAVLAVIGGFFGARPRVVSRTV